MKLAFPHNQLIDFQRREEERILELEKKLGNLFAQVIAAQKVTCAPSNIKNHFEQAKFRIPEIGAMDVEIKEE